MKFLIIQTAFIGDVVLATPLIEKLRQHYTDSTIDFLLQKGNEGLLTGHPHLRQVLIFDKKHNKYKNLRTLLLTIRNEKYDYVINLQRFLASGLLTALSGAKRTIGFDKNPVAFLFDKSVAHQISQTDRDQHEVKRNLSLIEHITDAVFVKPRLYPSEQDYKKIIPASPYVCIAPASIWFTKQWPAEKWIELIEKLPENFHVYLMGGKSDVDLCTSIKWGAVSRVPRFRDQQQSSIHIVAGQLSFLESAALMKNARMNFVNDSAPLHFASAMNAPVAAMYCSTVPAFGFGPLSDTSFVFETAEKLDCRPCGLHGYKQCPKGHFRCSLIDVDQVAASVRT
jgi:ADP-heptose:LPS heptosyltransferase